MINHFQRNFSAITKVLNLKYRDTLNVNFLISLISKYSDNGFTRPNFYEYVKNDQPNDPQNLLKRTNFPKLKSIAVMVEKELGMMISAEALVNEDLRHIFSKYADPVLAIREAYAAYQPESDKLAKELKRLRERKNISMIAVEKISKELYPDDKDRWISNGYVSRLETNKYGEGENLTPKKLLTLAQIYDANPAKLMTYVGLLPNSVNLEFEVLSIFVKRKWLDENNIPPENLTERIKMILRNAFLGLLIDDE